MHEVYHSPTGHWEAIYGNFEPSGIGATVFPYETESGIKTWRTPMDFANSGRLKTSKGRMMRTQGEDNDHVKEPGELLLLAFAFSATFWTRLVCDT